MKPQRTPFTSLSLRALPAAALTLLLCTPAFGYIVYFRDGTNLASKGPYRVEGDYALILLESGTETRVALSEIDELKTRRLNAIGVSDAVIIDEGQARGYRPGEGRQAEAGNLRDVIQRRRQLGGEAPVLGDGGNDLLPETSAGYPDLTSAIRRPMDSQDREAEYADVLRSHGVKGFRVYQGATDAERALFVEVFTKDRLAVFEQLAALCNATGDLIDQGASVVEVLLVDADRRRAGQFMLTGENAPLLVNERMTPQEFFVQFVQF